MTKPKDVTGVADLSALLGQVLNRLDQLEQGTAQTVELLADLEEKLKQQDDSINKLRHGDYVYQRETLGVIGLGAGLEALEARVKALEAAKPDHDAVPKRRKWWWD